MIAFGVISRGGVAIFWGRNVSDRSNSSGVEVSVGVIILPEHVCFGSVWCVELLVGLLEGTPSKSCFG